MFEITSENGLKVLFINFIFQWRRFNFFDKEIVKDPETNQNYDKLKVSQILQFAHIRLDPNISTFL